MFDVQNEILATAKGTIVAAIPPTLSIYFSNLGIGNAYCGLQDDRFEITMNYGGLYILGSFFLTWILSDFYEFFYHRLGHTQKAFWNVHKHHHVYYNPTPFAVIADELADQFMRALPLFLFPMLMPTNMDMLFGMYGVFFYMYGIYLHWGHELEELSAHHPWINTSFQHYIHHAKSIMNKPYHSGFFFKIWDIWFDSLWPMEDDITGEKLKGCLCAHCCRQRGERSREAWEKLDIPDYSELLNWKIWIKSGKSI